MPGALDQILAATRSTLPALRARFGELERAVAEAGPPPAFLTVRGGCVALIAEVKRRSPSAGAIAPALDPVSHARIYQAAGAAAISVLTNGPSFGGSLDDLRAVAEAVAIPVLRKDFILDEAQVLEARAAGAAAVLLIVRALTPERLEALLASAESVGLAALVEVHTAGEMDMALAAGAGLIGVNSRDLDTLSVDTASAWALLSRVPADRVAVAESGLARPADVARAAEAGADAVLVGTALSSDGAPEALAAALAAVPRRGR